jgi:hypothetical protein
LHDRALVIQHVEPVKPANDTHDQQPPVADRRWAWAEVLLILLVFFIFAGWPAPDVNEAHYLGKAKHYWNPQWCPGDHFLDSADAHLVFNWTFGWLTLVLPLPTVAWVGRALTWGLLAWAWQRLSYTLVPRRMMSLLSAALFLLLVQRLHMAGEWVVGGVEAKGFSFVLVLLALDAIVRDRWRRAWLMLGAASSFHVLIGGWSVVAAGVAWLVSGRDRPALVSMLPALAGGLLLALPGLIPGLALTWGTDADVVRQANEIYVFKRLPHHLVLHTLPPLYITAKRFVLSTYILRHVTLIVAWTGLCWFMRDDERQRRLSRFVIGALIIAFVGVLIDLATLQRPELAAALLRYYWFRLSDALVPAGAALACIGAITKLEKSRPVVAQWCLVAALLAAGANVCEVFYRQRQDFRPRADQQALPNVTGDPQRTREVYEDWRRVCQWVAENTQPDDRFLTPRKQQSFKWYAGRSEVATWKDVPQDAAALVEWWQRFQQVYPAGSAERDLTANSDEQLTALGHKYGARYLIVDRTVTTRPIGFMRLYPNLRERNATYEVYLLPTEKDEES